VCRLRGSHDNFVYINIVGLLDRITNGAGDGIGLQSNCAPRFYHGNSVGIGDRARKFAFNHAGMDTSHENVVTFLPQAIGDCADSEFYGAINEALLIPCVALF
jgi:hypothetical protein